MVLLLLSGVALGGLNLTYGTGENGEQDVGGSLKMRLSEERLKAVAEVIRNRLGEKVVRIFIEDSVGEYGDDIVLIQVHMSKDTTAEDFAGRLFGLTGLVRNAMGEDMRDVFPYIRPMEAHA